MEITKENVLKMFLEKMNEHVFVKSTNSVSGEVEELKPVVEDMEAVIKLSGEWDREDLKEILWGLCPMDAHIPPSLPKEE